jgi:hypothetical protein
VSDAPLIAGSVFGLRTWSRTADGGGDVLTAAHRDTPWPAGGAWLEAACGAAGGHAAPGPDCSCGIHAWHPRRASARRVLGRRFDVAGIVEAEGAIEIQDDGFRAARARPYAFVLTPGGNRALVERLAERYAAGVVEVGGAGELVAWCTEHDIGLAEPAVERILGPDRAAQTRALRRRRRRRDAAGVAAAVALSAAVLAGGAVFVSGPPSPEGVYGRTGWVKRPTCGPNSPPPRATSAGPGTARRKRPC